jgi:hypothetical protein
MPFPTVGPSADEPAVDPSRFHHEGRWAGFWSAPPTFHFPAEQQVIAAAAGEHLLAAIVPDNQRVVITLRDVQGLSASEVCDLLDIREANQRVLLHRARTKARSPVELSGQPGQCRRDGLIRQPEVRCVEFVEQVTEWLEGRPSDTERLLFEEHLAYPTPVDGT